MKPALVLGLALAANAMAADSGDNNELFVAPQGSLSELAQRFPGKIMYDEVADDELYHGNLPREAFKSDEEYRRYIVKRSAEEFDDEFLVRPLVPHISADDEELFVAPQGKLADLAKKYPGMIMFDEVADDELIVRLKSRDRFKTEEEYQSYLKRVHFTFDDAADDELAVRLPTLAPGEKFEAKWGNWREKFGNGFGERYGPGYKPVSWAAHDDELAIKIVHRPTAENSAYAFDDDELVAVKIPREKFPTEEAYRRYQVSLSEEAADDELLASDQSGPTNQPDQYAHTIIIHNWAMRTKDDEVTDDELLASYQPGLTNQPDQQVRTIIIHHWAMHTKDDEVADDELAFRAPRVFVDRNLPKHKNHTSEARPHLVKPAKNLTSETLVRDDEADDELLYLGQLIKDQVPRPFRGFDDDEFRAKGDKPAHVKIQEMGTEGPKMKRKLRPVVDGASLVQN